MWCRKNELEIQVEKFPDVPRTRYAVRFQCLRVILRIQEIDSYPLIDCAVIGLHDHRRPLAALRNAYRRPGPVDLLNPLASHRKRKPDLGIAVGEVEHHQKIFRGQHPGRIGSPAVGDDALSEVCLVEVVEKESATAKGAVIAAQCAHYSMEPHKRLAGAVIKVFPVQGPFEKIAANAPPRNPPVLTELLPVP